MGDSTRDPWTWRVRAKCREEDLTLFFHPDGERGHARRHRQDMAQRICQSCPVIADCRDFALRGNEPFGTWGGLTEEERVSLVSPQAVTIRTHRGSSPEIDYGVKRPPAPVD